MKCACTNPRRRYKTKRFRKDVQHRGGEGRWCEQCEDKMRYDPYSNRIHFSVASGEVVIVDNPRLHRMLGMRRRTTTFSNADADTKCLFVMPKQCAFNANGTMMFVYF